jgi:hypothetical protein
MFVRIVPFLITRCNVITINNIIVGVVEIIIVQSQQIRRESMYVYVYALVVKM